MIIRFGILTISDRSAQGVRPDLSGPALQDYIRQKGWVDQKYAIVPDDSDAITETLLCWVESGEVDVILTTGGTGFSPRDNTPEATQKVIEKLTPGISEIMRAESLKFTSHAILSRGISGIRGETLIINLPGSPKAAVENVATVAPVLLHAVGLIKGIPEEDTKH